MAIPSTDVPSYANIPVDKTDAADTKRQLQWLTI